MSDQYDPEWGDTEWRAWDKYVQEEKAATPDYSTMRCSQCGAGGYQVYIVRWQDKDYRVIAMSRADAQNSVNNYRRPQHSVYAA